jgi:ribosome-associated heat shock protein Hsp15
MRIDKFLWFARLARSRSAAQNIVEAGWLRLDGRRVDRAHTLVRPGSVIVLMQGDMVRVLRIDMLPARRGPATEAAQLFTDLTNQS